MLAKLGNWIRDFNEDETASLSGDAEWARTLAGLLVEAAMADGDLDDDERTQIAAALESQLHLTADEIATIIDGAIRTQEESIEIHSLTRAIRADTDADERVAIMEMAWMVVLADGNLHQYEAQLMRRLAGLLYVEDIDSGKAAKRARARLQHS
jgi:uncharacterized tellurite resistance protein B-like protein